MGAMAEIRDVPAMRAAAIWPARLSLGFARSQAHGTTLARNVHEGPLRVQRAFHPEGPEVAHVVMLHPPSGIAAGDSLGIEVNVQAGAHALLTTPGSTRWYPRAPRRAAGLDARQSVTLTVEDHASIEWLPQPAIVHDHADAHSTIRIDLAATSSFIGFDGVVLGRRSSGEGFATGRWRQTVGLARNGRLEWHDSARFEGGSRLLESRVGLDGAHVIATLVATSPGLGIALAAIDRDEPLAPARAAMPSAGVSLVTPHLLVARWLSSDPQAVWREAVAGWAALRPATIGREPLEPRIWST